MPDPLIRKRTPAETLTYIADRLREQPDATALLGHSFTLDMLAEELAKPDANGTVGRLNRALAELGMPAAVLTMKAGRGPSGWPVAVVRLAYADDPEAAYGEIRIPLRAKEDGRDG